MTALTIEQDKVIVGFEAIPEAEHAVIWNGKYLYEDKNILVLYFKDKPELVLLEGNHWYWEGEYISRVLTAYKDGDIPTDDQFYIYNKDGTRTEKLNFTTATEELEE